jgi:beta-galactosidase
MQVAFTHDVNRSLKGGRPFMLMESTPSNTNWQPVPKLKRPGMHLLSSLQAVAHGSDTVQYFQWRKSRGSSEKFHGAVVDHVGNEHTRVFKEVAQVGEILKKLDSVIGTTTRPEAAILYDWENRWAIEDMHALGRDIERRGYPATALSFYQPFWTRGIPVDVISEDDDFSNYKLIAAPMLYLLRPGVAERLRQFVAKGGTLVATYWTGLVDQTDLCFLGGWPGDGLRQLFGIWDEETDTLAVDERNELKPLPGNELGLNGSFAIQDYCALIHAEGARVLATYGRDFYAGRPALTVNDFGEGHAYYVAARTDEAFLDEFMGRLIQRLSLSPALHAKLPVGVSVQARSDGRRNFIFVMNFNPEPVTLSFDLGLYRSLITNEPVAGTLTLPGYGVEILE